MPCEPKPPCTIAEHARTISVCDRAPPCENVEQARAHLDRYAAAVLEVVQWRHAYVTDAWMDPGAFEARLDVLSLGLATFETRPTLERARRALISECIGVLVRRALDTSASEVLRAFATA